jgi:hypothetical protein
MSSKLTAAERIARTYSKKPYGLLHLLQAARRLAEESNRSEDNKAYEFIQAAIDTSIRYTLVKHTLTSIKTEAQ